MANNFKAKIRLAKQKGAPLSHTGTRGPFARTIKQGDSVITTNPEEAMYYQNISGFVVTVLRGKLVVPVEDPEPVDDDDEDDDGGEGEDESDDDDGDGSDGLYMKADLKKLKAKDLKELIKSDDDLPLSLKDVKGLNKPGIIEAILEAQKGDDEDEDED